MTKIVKFLKPNQNTLLSLINKQIKFSTVYEFDDFNELTYFSTYERNVANGFYSKYTDLIDQLYKQLYQKFQNPEFRITCLKYLDIHPYKDSLKSSFRDILNNGNFDKKPESFADFIIENIVYQSIGIFCSSNITVFEDDAAQLMFAHYADNLQGIAIIYDSTSPNNTSSDIDYVETIIKHSSSGEKDIKQLINIATNGYQSKHPKNFSKKSRKWSYQSEHRIFGAPGIQDIDTHKLSISAILYTNKTPKDFIEAIRNINKCIYYDKILILKILPGNTKFVHSNEDQSSLFDLTRWINNLP